MILHFLIHHGMRPACGLWKGAGVVPKYAVHDVTATLGEDAAKILATRRRHKHGPEELPRSWISTSPFLRNQSFVRVTSYCIRRLNAKNFRCIRCSRAPRLVVAVHCSRKPGDVDGLSYTGRFLRASGQIPCDLRYGPPEAIKVIPEDDSQMEYLFAGMVTPPVISRRRKSLHPTPAARRQGIFPTTSTASNDY
ncbi:hypothetical protein BDP55DRAFT_92389 [Colletotrichum godetiae]|uniref:Uncharacterized protein n=1 Tax=Colletotrichum godetiae TaxID=1209918 RepID=A0AAJ0ANE4_9PEZI|nr:uncharacterized protein BDP55DRAFT_92389 [Colletotrichum godetiae]KAK1687411.1 hypothetical protein BDP55DRAFT_92389 [Colletotrichum godetiae]